MGRFLKTYLGPLIAAVIATLVTGVVFQTQRVIAMMKTVGGDVSFTDRLSMTAYDLQHLGSLYGVFILIALSIALSLAIFIARRKPALSLPILMSAGAIAMLVLLFAMKQVFFDIHIIAGARDGLGIAMQMLAGAFGGYAFYRFRRKSAQQAA